MKKVSRKWKIIIAIMLIGVAMFFTWKAINAEKNPRHPALKGEEVYRKMREKEGEAWRKSNQNTDR